MTHQITTATATRRGVRAFNCDGLAIEHLGPITAAAVIDGIGNTPDIARTSRLLAEVAARVGARRGSLAGLLAAAETIAARDAQRPDPDAVGVLAVARPDLDLTTVAWIGDARAYGWDGTRLRQYSTDHTIGQQLRQNGAPWELAEDHDNWIRTTLTQATVATVYEADIPDPLVLLTSDGIHDSIHHPELEALVRTHRHSPQALADAIVQATREDEDGYRDDASIAILARPL